MERGHRPADKAHHNRTPEKPKTMQVTWKQLDAVTGGLSKPSKMPCHGWSIPASRCKVGSLLRNTAGSTCSSCYALKGRYVFANVQSALERRLSAYDSNPAQWADAMVASILKTGETHFRWFDSGDLQSPEMLRWIVYIAERTPAVTHWLPTREYGIVRQYMREHSIPANLTVRVSAPMVGGPAPSIPGTVTSGVDDAGNHGCPAYTQGGKCGDCRACWDRSVSHVTYPKH